MYTKRRKVEGVIFGEGNVSDFYNRWCAALIGGTLVGLCIEMYNRGYFTFVH